MADQLKPVDYKKIIRYVLQNWQKLGLPETDQTKLGFKVLPFRRSGPHSLLNFMISSADAPVLVVRGPRFISASIAIEGLKHEALLLKELLLIEPLKAHIPILLKDLLIDDCPILLVKACSGTMLHTLLDTETVPDKLARLIRSGADLAQSLHLATKKPERTLDSKLISDQAAKTLPLVRQHLPEKAAALEKQLELYLQKLGNEKTDIPGVCSHEEFNPWNILQQPGGQLIALDWEDAVSDGLPLLDLYNYFLICMRILIAGESQSAKQRPQTEQQQRFAILLRTFTESIAAYCQALNLPEQAKDPLFVLFGLRSLAFFLDPKRQSVAYAKHWLPLLTGLDQKDLFSEHLAKEARGHWRANKK
ncbi:MAG: phosphotransferase [Candidatus Saganbacteria bacterium]|nr:phosphotransferase [Candidatus Saganbacteria bacterium]